MPFIIYILYIINVSLYYITYKIVNRIEINCFIFDKNYEAVKINLIHLLNERKIIQITDSYFFSIENCSYL